MRSLNTEYYTNRLANIISKTYLNHKLDQSMALVLFALEDPIIQEEIISKAKEKNLKSFDEPLVGTSTKSFYSPPKDFGPFVNELIYIYQNKNVFLNKLSETDLLFIFIDVFEYHSFWSISRGKLFTEMRSRTYQNIPTSFIDLSKLVGFDKLGFNYLSWCEKNKAYDRFKSIKIIKKQYQIERVII